MNPLVLTLVPAGVLFCLQYLLITRPAQRAQRAAEAIARDGTVVQQRQLALQTDADGRADAAFWRDEARQLREDLKAERDAARTQREDLRTRIQNLEQDMRDFKAGDEARTAAAVAQATADLAVRHQQDLVDLTAKHQAELKQLADEATAQRAALQGQLALVQGQLDVRRQQQIAPDPNSAAAAPAPAVAGATPA